MGKTAKEHRKKVAKRNETISIQKKKMEMTKDEFLKKFIEKERLAGKFDKYALPDETQILGASAPVLTEMQGPII